MEGARVLALAVCALAIAAPAALGQLPQLPVLPVPAPVLDAPDLEVLAPAAPLPAKSRVNVFLSVLNLGPGDVSDVAVLAQPGVGGLVVVGQTERDLDLIPENDSALLVVRVATPDAAGGATLLLTFAFRDADGNVRTVVRTVSIQIAPPRSDPLRVEFDEERLPVGGGDSLRLTLANPSDRPITQLDVTVDPESRTFIDTGESDLLPGGQSSLVVQGATLPAGARAQIEAPVLTSLNAGDLLEFRVIARYTFEGFQREQTFEFGARAVGEVNVRVMEAREVETPDGLEVVGTVVNTGRATAWNPRVNVAEGSGLRAAAPKLIEDLEPNDAVNFRIRVERVGERVPGAPLLVLDYNDDFGEVHPISATGDLQPLPPPAPGRVSALWSQVRPYWPILAVGLVLLVALVASVRHWIREHRAFLAAEEERREALEAGEVPSAEAGGPRKRRGAKPGG